MFASRLEIGQITVAYPLSEIEETMNELFGILKLSLPLALLMTIGVGYVLARYSLRQVDVITQSAQEITAHNLSNRLPMPEANDEIARLTSTLNEMIARLEASFAQIRQFTSDASHELRTPLAILMGEMELALRRTQTIEQYQEVITSSLEEVIRLSKVVESLLEISRAESGQVRLRFELLNLSKIATDVCEDLEILAMEKHINLRYEIQPFVSLIADEMRLHQLLLNVIDNAIKYTYEDGSVSVKVLVENTNAKIVVSDTGVGIPEEDAPHIFNRFYRVDKSRSHDVTGTGLGLSIVKWIVDAHKGTIEVASTHGVGTTFTITLPADGR
jgi:heavy metal sensor kinase